MSKEQRNVPKLRFPEFTGEWEQRKLKDILEERHTISTYSEEYPRLSFTIEEGVILLSPLESGLLALFGIIPTP